KGLFGFKFRGAIAQATDSPASWAQTDSADEDLAASKTDGFKVGEKKTVEEYAKLDQNDESLNRWKASLGITNSPALPVDPKDTRRCVIQSLALEVAGRPDITIDLSVPGALQSLKSKPFSIKEGSKFRMKATFKVQHDVLSGLKYIQVVKRKGIRVSKDEEMLGSYAPNTQEKPIHEKKFAEDEAPSGMIARGHYEAVSRFADDDDNDHLRFEWSFDITKDWK
ncbi:MAG: hypothetical protein Q9177_002918, partial [Variospora cf. flavescens]